MAPGADWRHIVAGIFLRGFARVGLGLLGGVSFLIAPLPWPVEMPWLSPAFPTRAAIMLAESALAYIVPAHRALTQAY